MQIYDSAVMLKRTEFIVWHCQCWC